MNHYRLTLLHILLVLLCYGPISIQAQSSFGTVGLEELKERHEDEDLVITDWKRDFQFKYSPVSGLMEVKEYFQMDYLNLTDDPLSTIYPIFVDDYSSIRSIKSGGTKLKADPFPFEMDGIFHHDAEVNPVQVYVRTGTTPTRLYFQKEYSDSKYLTRKFFGARYPVESFTLTLKFPKNSEVEALLFYGEEFGIKMREYDQGLNHVIEFTGDSLPAFEKESFSKGAAFYEPHIIILTKGVTINGERRNLLSTTDDLYGWYASLVKEIGNESDDLAAFTADLVKDCPDSRCELETIYYWVQDNIRYIAFEDGIAGFRPEACQDVFYNKYGDCKGMANLMTEMLRSRGVDARLTWIGTQAVPYDYSIPSLSVDNHMICTVIQEDGSYLFLDGTEKFITLDDVAERIQGRPVMIENGNSYILAEVPSFTHHRNKELLEINYAIAENKLTGQFNYSVTGEGKVRMMNRYADVPSKDRSEAQRLFFSRGLTDIHIGEGEYTDLKERTEEIAWSASFEAKNRVNQFGDELYLDWDIYRSYARSRFKEEDMDDIKGDLNFRSKVFDIERYRIEPIEGFKLKDLPEDFSVDEKHFKLEIGFKANDDGSIEIEKKVIIPHASIPNDDLHEWNETIERLEEEVYDRPIIYEKF
ncbi:MAG: transglutaminase domain-containing protein [Flavobacteriales bacterium]|nr:transglutaminase domain-containing protein [Flavobacteriales bacterium]